MSPTVTLPIIGALRTPYATLADIPRQAALNPDAIGRAELYPEYAPGLANLEEFGRIWLYFLFDQATATDMIVRSRKEGRPMGVFATRSPARPARLGVSLVELVSVEGSTVTFKGVDMLDNTPLLDIKPYIEDLPPASL